jgi:hypothetical protein
VWKCKKALPASTVRKQTARAQSGRLRGVVMLAGKEVLWSNRLDEKEREACDKRMWVMAVSQQLSCDFPVCSNTWC